MLAFRQENHSPTTYPEISVLCSTRGLAEKVLEEGVVVSCKNQLTSGTCSGVRIIQKQQKSACLGSTLKGRGEVQGVGGLLHPSSHGEGCERCLRILAVRIFHHREIVSNVLSANYQTLLPVEMEVGEALLCGFLIRGSQLLTHHPWRQCSSLVDFTG